MKPWTKLWVWSCGWTPSHCWFLICFALFWLAVALWAEHRFEQARDAALYWQERAITNTVFHK
jgi:hypothetical protein